MKKLLYLLLAMPLVFAACSDDKTAPEDTSPAVAFNMPLVPMTKGEATVTLVLRNFDMLTMADEEQIEVQVQVGGTAVEGTDYTISGKSFILKKEAPSMTLTVSSKNFGPEAKTIELSLVAPEGFKLGKIAQTKVTLDPRKIYYQFVAFAAEMTDQVQLEVQVVNDDGTTKRIDEEIAIPLKVDASSTAVLNTNFEFEGGTPQIVVPKGNFKGTLNINQKKYDAAKNKIVLDLGEVDGMLIGDPGRITITMKPSEWDLLTGTYTVESQLFTKEWITSNYGDQPEADFKEFPVLNTADEFTFDIPNGKLTPNLQSKLKNFFIGESNIVKSTTVRLRPYNGTGFQGILALQIELDNVNRNFDANNQSADKKAYIAVRWIKNDAQEDRLELYIIDYKPTSFLQTLTAQGWLFTEERPSATTTGAFHQFILKRKN